MEYLTLLKQNKLLRRLSLLQIFAYFGAWFSHVAIYTMLVEFQASSVLISVVIAMNFLPSILLSPFLGSLIDRLNIKKFILTLLIVEVLMTSCYFFITSLEDIYLLIGLIFIRMSSASAFFTSEMALLPKVLDGKLLTKANEIHSIIWSLTFALGMAIGGIVVDIFGIYTAFFIDIVFFIIAIVILINTKIDVKITFATQNIFLDIKDGFNYIKNNNHLIKLMLLHGTVGWTAFDSLVTLLADYQYKYIISIPLAIGIVNAIRAFSLMIGPFIISNWIDKKRLFYLFIAQGLAIVIWAILQGNFYISLIGISLTGLVTTTLWSYTYSMLQEKIEQKFLGRVLSYNEMVFMIMNISTTLFIGFMATLVSLDIITAILGFAFIVTAFYYRRVFL